ADPRLRARPPCPRHRSALPAEAQSASTPWVNYAPSLTACAAIAAGVHIHARRASPDGRASRALVLFPASISPGCSGSRPEDVALVGEAHQLGTRADTELAED